MQLNKIYSLYKKLRKKYGHPQGQWSLWCKRPKTLAEKEEVIIGTILTQRANWKNVKLAIKNLQIAKRKSLSAIYELGRQNRGKLAAIIKPSGFYKQKARYLFGIAEFFVKIGGIKKVQKIELNELRSRLLSLRGIGPETADSILLYALEKPVFVIDEYTRRLAKKERLARNLSYHHLQKLFESNLPKNYKLFQDFHALIVIDGKTKNIDKAT